MEFVRDAAAQVTDVSSGPIGSGLLGGVQTLYASAVQGRFAVSGEGGTPLLVTIARFKEWMETQSDNVDMISQRPPLGRLQGGEVMAPFMVKVATDSDGFATRFRELRESLTMAEEAIKQAIANYQRLDAENRIRLMQAESDARRNLKEHGWAR